MPNSHLLLSDSDQFRESSNHPAVDLSVVRRGKTVWNCASYSTTTITASYGGQTATTTLTVRAPTLVSITVSPNTYTIASGTALQFHATGNYSDNSTLDLTSQVSWSSTNSTAATVSNTSGSQGLSTGVNPGTVTITAVSGGVQGAASVTVQ